MYNLIGKSATRQVGFIIIEVVYYKNSDEKKTEHVKKSW